MRVSFLIAGVQKGGTSSLDAYLRQHPEVCMAKAKEPHYFDSEAADVEAYHALFAPGPGTLAIGEATPIYTYWPQALPRIHAYNPAMKLIVLLRDPAQRAWSQWRMEHGRGDEILGFGEAIRSEAERAKAALPFKHRVYSYLDRGLYAPQVERLRALFPPSQALFLRSEDFLAEPQRVMQEVCAFLQVAPWRFDVAQRHNVGREEGPVPPEDLAYMAAFFREDSARTAALLGWDKPL